VATSTIIEHLANDMKISELEFFNPDPNSPLYLDSQQSVASIFYLAAVTKAGLNLHSIDGLFRITFLLLLHPLQPPELRHQGVFDTPCRIHF